MSKSDLVTVTVNKLELFLVIDCVEIVSDEPTNVTVAPVVSNKEPLTCIVEVPPAVGSIVPVVISEPPSIVNCVIVGGASIDFHSVPV